MDGFARREVHDKGRYMCMCMCGCMSGFSVQSWEEEKKERRQSGTSCNVFSGSSFLLSFSFVVPHHCVDTCHSHPPNESRSTCMFIEEVELSVIH